jgi:hypothetical protein
LRCAEPIAAAEKRKRRPRIHALLTRRPHYGCIMQSRDFCFWLQGFFELGDQTGVVTAEQAALIERHLDLVFAHEIAPSLRERLPP